MHVSVAFSRQQSTQNESRPTCRNRAVNRKRP
jgi:hypothetical protein